MMRTFVIIEKITGTLEWAYTCTYGLPTDTSILSAGGGRGRRRWWWWVGGDGGWSCH